MSRASLGAVVATSALLAVNAKPDPASAALDPVSVFQVCAQPWSQICDPAPGYSAPYALVGDGLALSYSWQDTNCSDFYLHVFLDGIEVDKALIPQASTTTHTLSTIVSVGDHTLSLQAEGFVNGCNTGIVGQWNGVFTILAGATSITANGIPTTVDGEQSRGGGSGKHSGSTTARRSDPVDTLTGAFVHGEDDLAFAGLGYPLHVARLYNSDDPTVGVVGRGWSLNLAARLVAIDADTMVFVAEDGQRLRFERQADLSWLAATGVTDVLRETPTGFEVETLDQTFYEFDAAGSLQSARDRSGEGIVLSYSAGDLVSATDGSGRSITFGYNASGRVELVSGSDGRQVSYGYTGDLLTSVIDARGKTWSYEYDPAGRLTRVVDPLGHAEVTNTYDPVTGRVATQLDALGNESTFAWAAGSGLSTFTDASGAVSTDRYLGGILRESVEPDGRTTSQWDADANPAVLTDENGNATVQSFDAAGNVLRRDYPSGAFEAWSYDGMNNPLTYRDRRGLVTEYEYDVAGRLLVERRLSVSPVVTSWTYTARGQVETMTDPRGGVWSYAYDLVGNRISETSPLGFKRTWTYDAAGRVLTETSPRGNVLGGIPADFTTIWTYDDAGNVLTETDPLGRRTVYAYDDAGRLATMTDPLLRVTSYEYNFANELIKRTEPGPRVFQFGYDERGLLVSETSPTGGVTRYTYDGAGRRKTMITPRGNTPTGQPAVFTWTYGYDGAGNQTEVRDPFNNLTTMTYDVENRLETRTMPGGRTWTYSYDVAGAPFRTTDPLGGITEKTYDSLGRLQTERDERAQITTYGYDQSGNQTLVIAPNGARTVSVYDADGRLSSVVEPRGNLVGANPDTFRSRFEYDADGNQTATVDPLGNRTETGFDRVGNRTSVKDPRGFSTTWGYEDLNRITSVTIPGGFQTTYTYDTAGNVRTRRDPKLRTTTFGYDLAGRVTSEANPIGTTTYSYDIAGNMTRETRPGPVTITRGYDRLELLRTINYSDTTPDVTLSYDNNQNLASMVDGAGTETYGYDLLNRRKTITRGSEIFRYEYLANGLLQRRTMPGGRTESYTYTSNDQLASTSSALGVTFTYGYDIAGNLTRVNYPSLNGQVQTNSYDAAGRITNTATTKGTTTLFSENYRYDRSGNPTRVLDNTGLVTLYEYDTRNWLTGNCTTTSTAATNCTGVANKTTTSYDRVGNRLTTTTGGQTTTYNYNAKDQLASMVSPTGTTTYLYDARGNRRTAGSRTFSYDAENRLTSTTQAGATTSYGYDGNGRRLTATTGATTTGYRWDPQGSLAQLADETTNGVVTTQYINGPAGPIALRQGGTLSYLHADRLGSTRTTTNGTGSKQRSYRYDPYGTIANQTGTGTTPRLLFTGQYQDPTGQYHLRARQYDPTTATFTATDPLSRSTGEPWISTYNYADGMPTIMTDPSGMRGVTTLGGKLGSSAKTYCRKFGKASYGSNWIAWGFNTIAEVRYWLTYEVSGSNCQDVSKAHGVYSFAEFYTDGHEDYGSVSYRWISRKRNGDRVLINGIEGHFWEHDIRSGQNTTLDLVVEVELDSQNNKITVNCKKTGALFVTFDALHCRRKDAPYAVTDPYAGPWHVFG